MMAWHRNACLSVSGVKGHSLVASPLLETGCQQDRLPELPKHNTQLCVSGLEAAAFTSQIFPHCTEQSWRLLSNRASLGLFNLLHKCGGDCYISHSFPPPLCASGPVPECHGLHHEAGLSTGIYEQRNQPKPSRRLKALMCSSWLLILLEMFSCIINTEKKKLFGEQAFQGLRSNKKQL